jgi:methylenetetrahydrofolate reductase (NADPH)
MALCAGPWALSIGVKKGAECDRPRAEFVGFECGLSEIFKPRGANSIKSDRHQFTLSPPMTYLAPMPQTTAMPLDEARQFLRLASVEITPKQIEKIPLLAERMAPGAQVYIALIDPNDVAGQIEAARVLRGAGLDPVPHVPARFVKDRDDLARRLGAFGAAGVTRALVLGGGAPQPIGVYDAAIQLLETGLFEANGLTRLGLAGHPEGNPDIEKARGAKALVEALKAKQAYFTAHGIQGHIATQFLFEAGPVTAWARGLRGEGITLPVRVGVPGPATIKTLVKFAAMCGVGASARFIRKQALNVTKLLTVSTPDQFVSDLARFHVSEPQLGIAAPHLYPFGGFDKLFDWITPRH